MNDYNFSNWYAIRLTFSHNDVEILDKLIAIFYNGEDAIAFAKKIRDQYNSLNDSATVRVLKVYGNTEEEFVRYCCW